MEPSQVADVTDAIHVQERVGKQISVRREPAILAWPHKTNAVWAITTERGRAFGLAPGGECRHMQANGRCNLK
jgi:hypothetical protein